MVKQQKKKKKKKTHQEQLRWLHLEEIYIVVHSLLKSKVFGLKLMHSPKLCMFTQKWAPSESNKSYS